MDQRTADREALPPFEAVMKQKARGSATAAGTPDKYVDIERSPLINGDDLRLVRYGIVSGAGKAITAVTQAAAVSSSLGSSLRIFRVVAPISAIVWEQPYR